MIWDFERVHEKAETIRTFSTILYSITLSLETRHIERRVANKHRRKEYPAAHHAMPCYEYQMGVSQLEHV